VHLCRLLLFSSILIFTSAAPSATVLVLQFHNTSQYTDLSWVGESIAETIRTELSGANQIVLDRESRAEGVRRLSLRPDAAFTKATLIRLGQTLDADYLCSGSYNANLPPGDTQLKNSSIQVTAHFMDLRKMHDGPDVSEAGKLSDLSRMEQHLAWEALKYVDPSANLPLDQFMTSHKLVRMDAEESYVRGLLSVSPEQQQKWFLQAAALDPHYSNPAFQLGKLAFAHKDYHQAITWFQRVTPENSEYQEARFKMGLSGFATGNYSSAATDFSEVVKTYPLSEVYNNLGAAESELGLPGAVDDFRRALDGDQNDPVYLFNLGAALLKNNYFDEAWKRLQAVLARNPGDTEARSLLERAQRHDPGPSGTKPVATPRLKQNFDGTAFRQLKAMLQEKRSK
jgi:tetratricopeptide (TPR) repeat protein